MAARVKLLLCFVFVELVLRPSGLHARAAEYEPREGDILFQSLPRNELVKAIEGVSRSEFSHCGIVAKKGTKWVVIEALGSVEETSLASWKKRGRNGRFWAYRFRPELSEKIPEIVAATRTYLGRPYDVRYRFDDEYIYCSELIFKAYRTVTGKDLGKVHRLGELNWKPHRSFIRQMENGDLPLEREMITPVHMSKAPELELVYGKK